MQKINEQLDIFGNWKPLDKVYKEKKLNEKYEKKILKFRRDYIKAGGVLYVNKAFIKPN